MRGQAGGGGGGKRLGRCLSPADGRLQPSGSPLSACLHPPGSGQEPGSWGQLAAWVECRRPHLQSGAVETWALGAVESRGQGLRPASRGKACSAWHRARGCASRPQSLIQDTGRVLGSALSPLGGGEAPTGERSCQNLARAGTIQGKWAQGLWGPSWAPTPAHCILQPSLGCCQPPGLRLGCSHTSPSTGHKWLGGSPCTGVWEQAGAPAPTPAPLPVLGFLRARPQLHTAGVGWGAGNLRRMCPQSY